ncbi:alpha/beta fold hydrolase [Polymorphobacter sp.]|uniref:alpha/beta fold hydrolase n=1 Tax=Polymorphobacter sp. TaxID=1909290 RepID=UPI003F6FC991
MTITRRTTLGLLAATPAIAKAATTAPQGPWNRQGDIAVGGGSLHWQSLGEGGATPLILLHKLGGWIADWRHVAPALAANRRVIAFDLPGHGASVMHGPPPSIMTVPEVAAMVLAALDDMGLGPVHIAGNSMGGITAAVIAACWPERVKTLGLVSVSLIDRISRADIAQQDVDRKAQGLADGVLPVGIFATMVPEVTEEQVASRAAAGPWLRPCERGVGWVGVTDYLPRVKAPTLMVNADRGQYVRHIATGKRLIPNVTSVEIPEAGSFVHQERPTEVAAAMNAFLGQHG